MKYDFEKLQERLFVLSIISIILALFIDSNFFYFSLHGYMLPYSHLYSYPLWIIVGIAVLAMVANSALNKIGKFDLGNNTGIKLVIYKNGNNKSRIHIGLKLATHFRMAIGKYNTGMQIARNRMEIIERIFAIFREFNFVEMEITSHLINKKTLEILRIAAQNHDIEIHIRNKWHPSLIHRFCFWVVYRKKLNESDRITIQHI